MSSPNRPSRAPVPAAPVWRVLGRRLAIAAVALPLALLLGSPSAGSLDLDYRYHGALGNRGDNLWRQEEAVAQGRYLTDAEGGSFTRQASEAIGANLLFADLALWARLTGAPPPTRASVFEAQRWASAVAVAALALLGAPAWCVATALAILAAFPSPAHTLAGQRTWPQLLAIGLMLGALLRIARAARDGLRAGPDAAALFVLGLGAGLAGQVRNEAGLGAAGVLVGLIGLAGLAALLPPPRWPGFDALRARLLASRRGWRGWPRRLAGVQRREARIALLAGIALLGVVTAPVLVRANVALFEWLEETPHEPVRGSHLFWHPMLLGLGYDFHTQENLAWNDPIGIAEMHLATGDFRGYQQPGYEPAIRARYLEILRHNTPFVWQAYLHKARSLLLPDDRPTTPPLLLGALLALGWAALRPGARRADEVVLVAGGAGLVALFAAPPLLSGMAYADAFEPALVAAAVLGVAAVASRPGGPEPGTPPQSDFADRTRRAVALAVGGAVLTLALAAGHAGLILRHRDQLAEDLRSGRGGREALLREYPVDASLAFNSLPEAERAALADDWLTGTRRFSPRVPAPERGTAETRRSAILGTAWHDHGFFVFLRNERTLRSGVLLLDIDLAVPAVIPVGDQSRMNFAPPYTIAREVDQLTRRLYLPTVLIPGTWLFSAHLPPQYVTSVRIDEQALDRGR